MVLIIHLLLNDVIIVPLMLHRVAFKFESIITKKCENPSGIPESVLWDLSKVPWFSNLRGLVGPAKTCSWLCFGYRMFFCIPVGISMFALRTSGSDIFVPSLVNILVLSILCHLELFSLTPPITTSFSFSFKISVESFPLSNGFFFSWRNLKICFLHQESDSRLIPKSGSCNDYSLSSKSYFSKTLDLKTSIAVSIRNSNLVE